MNRIGRNITGYGHPAYARCFEQLGEPIQLRNSNAWLIKRQIPGEHAWDAMGCYPVFSCDDWSGLATDLKNIGTDLISVSMVTDPFGNYDVSLLRKTFPDLVTPFKDHFVVDLTRPINSFVSAHHLRSARKARQYVEVHICDNPADYLNDWVKLYSCLIERHKIAGIRAFSEDSFAKQLRVPGIKAFRATHEGKTVGMILWYVDQGIGNYHLGAFNEVGYRHGASFVLFLMALNYFADSGLRWLNLQAEAGIQKSSNDGLRRFKMGWSTGVREVYFCGRIFDRPMYAEITRKLNKGGASYFPAYRAGEFV